MIVVGDASALIVLHRLEAWPLLPRLYGQVHVPDAVWQEVFLAARFSSAMPAPPEWLRRHAPPATTPPIKEIDSLIAVRPTPSVWPGNFPPICC